jgi:hypothetical protein
MDKSIIIILGIILLVLIILNHITIIQTTTTTTQANCSQTAFGCCPDGVNSKINYYGTNCPGYNPGPGYYPTPYVPPPPPEPTPPPEPAPIPPPPKPIGGCSGTRYGCCPSPYSNKPKIDPQGSNCLVK